MTPPPPIMPRAPSTAQFFLIEFFADGYPRPSVAYRSHEERRYAASQIKAMGWRVIEVDAYVSSVGVISLSVGNPAYIEAAKDDADG